MAIAFPSDSQRLAIFGATGSGKTQAALWHLSHRSYETMPWIIYNTKSDAAINAIPYAHHIEIDEVPVEPGVFIVEPLAEEEEELQAHLRSVWNRGYTGVYIDEGYAMGHQNKPFRNMLTQGRSRMIPMIVLSQRPVWIDRFVFSESEFLQSFRLQHRKDIAAMEEVIPRRLDRLPEYHSWYYDALRNDTRQMTPVPDIKVIHSTFARRLSRERRRAVI